MRKQLQKFLEYESASGVLLIIIAAVAFFLSNSALSDSYYNLLNYELFGWTAHHFVNDALMTVFFYVVGLEIKKEMLDGSLKDPKKSSLAIFGALGGMLIPAGIYSLINSNAGIPEQSGWAIPMATDIAFAVGVLSLLGSRVSNELKVFLLALAIVDDLGAVIVIAFFYTKNLSFNFLFGSTLVFTVIYLLNRYRPQKHFVYVILGAFAWYLVYKSGIHATIAGVLLALLTPFKKKVEETILYPVDFWLHRLQPYIAFAIMPIFAFFNAGVTVGNLSPRSIIDSTVATGILFGLLIGKPLGIVLFCRLSQLLKIAQLPESVTWKQMMGVGFVAGIGFTMSLFVNNLTFINTEFENYAKIGVLLGSICSGIIGYVVLLFFSKNQIRYSSRNL